MSFSPSTFQELVSYDVLWSGGVAVPEKTTMVYLGAGIRPASPDHVAFFLDGETVWVKKDVLNTAHFKVIVRFRDCIVVDV